MNKRPLLITFITLAICNTTVAQFAVKEFKHTEVHYIDGYVEGTGESRLFSVSSKKYPESAKKINNQLFQKQMNKSFVATAPIDSYFPVRDEYGIKQSFDYEILENSKRFLTVHVSYQRPNKDVRSHRYYTFISVTGDLKEMWDLIDEDSFYKIATMAFKSYAKNLDTYISKMDTTNAKTKEQYNVLVECAKFYFEKENRFEYGYIYLMSDGVHCINPPCPTHYGYHPKSDWFTCKFSYNKFKPYFTKRIIKYGKRGVWL